ncbi:MAG: ATP-binding cassette domain-containing protein [Clostridiales bacterium]|nr:ATP-binding cassette domain-containing protein [Clostridiales bacterium]
MISIRNLQKSFDDKVLFDNFNLDIPDGSFVVISGESGSGKSTLLNMIGGIEEPDSGTITVDGFDVTGKGSKRKYYRDVVGFLFQNFALLENKTVKENLEMIQKAGRSGVEIGEALDKVGLTDVLNKKVYKLSGGEQQRIALARLMIKKCSVILADEPTGSLDKRNSEVVMSVLHDLNLQGKTVIVVTHDEDIVSRADNVVYLR